MIENFSKIIICKNIIHWEKWKRKNFRKIWHIICYFDYLTIFLKISESQSKCFHLSCSNTIFVFIWFKESGRINDVEFIDRMILETCEADIISNDIRVNRLETKPNFRHIIFNVLNRIFRIITWVLFILFSNVEVVKFHIIHFFTRDVVKHIVHLLNLQHLVVRQIDHVYLEIADVRVNDLRKLLWSLKHKTIHIQLFSLNF